MWIIQKNNDSKRFESCSIVLYVSESNVKMPSYIERDLFRWLDIKDQLKLLSHELCEVVA